MAKSPWYYVSALSLVVALVTTCTPQPRNVVVIACASNLQFVLGEMIDSVSANNKVTYELKVASSGKLFAQTIEGAHIDVLLTADTSYTHELKRQHQLPTSPVTFCYGKLAIWAQEQGLNTNLDNLSNLQINKLALPSPKTAPFGRAAMEALKKSNQWQHLEDKIVYAQNVTDVNHYILQHAVDMAFTSTSSKQVIHSGNWTNVDSSLYTPLPQSYIVVRQSPEAQQFVDFVHSEAGKNILRKHHYETSVQ